MEPIVSISHLTYAYGDRVAVNDLSLALTAARSSVSSAPWQREDHALPHPLDADPRALIP